MIFSLFLLLIVIYLVGKLVLREYSDIIHPKGSKDDDIEEY
jgi:Na+-transporting methylmalonyl-CoA/oxaloacetate decarboxylase gamma subunit